MYDLTSSPGLLLIMIALVCLQGHNAVQWSTVHLPGPEMFARGQEIKILDLLSVLSTA